MMILATTLASLATLPPRTIPPALSILSLYDLTLPRTIPGAMVDHSQAWPSGTTFRTLRTMAKAGILTRSTPRPRLASTTTTTTWQLAPRHRPTRAQVDECLRESTRAQERSSIAL